MGASAVSGWDGRDDCTPGMLCIGGCAASVAKAVDGSIG